MKIPESKADIAARYINKASRNVTPLYYSVSGSHLYGFADEDSDIDIRGIHIVDEEEYLKLGGVRDRFSVNQGNTVTPGFGDHADIEIVSYELKKFCQLILDMNFNRVEALLHGQSVLNNYPQYIDDLKQIVRKYLPLNISVSYHGMAKHNYEKYIANEESESYKPVAKKYLYVIRGLLGAKYAIKEGKVQPNVLKLAEQLLDDSNFEVVDTLVSKKVGEESQWVTGLLKGRVDHLVSTLFDKHSRIKLGQEGRQKKEEYKDDLNEWMLSLRREYGEN